MLYAKKKFKKLIFVILA